jgi:hypothetical protein
MKRGAEGTFSNLLQASVGYRELPWVTVELPYGYRKAA